MFEKTSSATSIARIIEVQIRSEHSPEGRGFVTASPIPSSQTSLAPFVQKFFPRNTIENLGRRTALYLGVRGDYQEYSLFFQALHHCFARHYPLALRPEVLLYLVVNEIATAVNQNPETFRDVFTSSSEKEKIEVIDNSLIRGNPDCSWGHTINLFEEKLAEKVPPATMEALLPRFSTETIESRAATLVAFMDAAQSFYEYHTGTLCGIPRIRLDGSLADWQKFSMAVDEMSQIFGRTAHLRRYFKHLLPVVFKIVDQAGSAPLDNEFWSSIYKWRSVSGGDHCGGWITAFLAYTRDGHGQLLPKEESLFDWKCKRAPDSIGSGSFPTHLSTAPFLWTYYEEKLPMTYVGGILGVENDGGFVSPQLSYAVLNGDPSPVTARQPAPFRR